MRQEVTGRVGEDQDEEDEARSYEYEKLATVNFGVLFEFYKWADG
jgi:hypothetical protein